jgi:hypothetical protein
MSNPADATIVLPKTWAADQAISDGPPTEVRKLQMLAGPGRTFKVGDVSGFSEKPQKRRRKVKRRQGGV